MAISPDEPGSASFLFGTSMTRLFMSRLSFLLPNHQCESTEENTKH